MVRVSGFEASKALQKMTNLTNPKPKTAFLRKIRDPETGEIIDNGLCLWFPGKHIFFYYNNFYKFLPPGNLIF